MPSCVPCWPRGSSTDDRPDGCVMSAGILPALPQAAALLRSLWDSPQPATLQGADFRLLDVNEAYANLVGLPREQLIGLDPIELQPAEDRELNRAARVQLDRLRQTGASWPPLRRRLLDRSGQEHWFSLAVSNMAEAGAPPLLLCLLQDLSAEHHARRLASRAEGELSQWFELSGSGMLVYDASGLIVRCNAAFEALVERVPEVLDDAPPELQHLLAWHNGAMEPALVPGALPVERQVLLALSDGRRRRLWARLACQPGDAASRDAVLQLAGHVPAPTRRVMAVVQDRSAEDERDLAQLEMGMLMDTASVGVATYDPARGWLAPQQAPKSKPQPAAHSEGGAAASAGDTRRKPSGALLGIGRELVEPASLPEFERLQRALRSGERTEVRYAVRHPDLGLRWLLTRVEPGALAGGRNTTSIVTLDVTEQEAAQRRNDQLLRELTTILDSSTAGIAYLRGPALVRCNRRFERMLGFDAGAAAGASLAEILARSLGTDAAAAAQQAQEALAQGRAFEAELSVAAPGGVALWYSLSLRAAASETTQSEVVAVLTDITRLKGQQTELEQLLRDRELMFSLSEVGIVYQRGARIERANQAMADITGWTATEMSTLDAAELYASARECVDFETRIAKELREHGRFSGERRLRRRDGRLCWVQVAVRPVKPEAPAEGVICSFVDVDERRRARETLAQQVERTRAILNSVLVGIVTVSERGIEWMNRSARRMFAGELADFVGEPISGVATPEPEHPLRRVDWLQRLQQGQAETFECRLRGRDGREFWVVGNAVLTTPGGDVNAVSGTQTGYELTFALLDIEKRRQAEVSIARAQASLQRVIENAPLAIALFDAHSLRVQQLNQTASAFFGRPVEEALGALPQDLCAPALSATLQRWLSEVAATGLGQQHEWPPAATPPHDRPETQPVWDCRFTPLADSTAGTAQLLLVATDVTAQRTAERARLRAAIDQREVLVREVHHRIKNNLQGVAGLLQQNAARQPELAAALSEAVGQVQAIAQVYGLQVGATGPLALAGLLRAICGSVQRTFGQTIVFGESGAVPHMLPEAEAIPVALTVNELLTNAIKHGRGDVVRCELSADDAGVRIAVANAGELPAGFDVSQVRSAVSGLGLVRALLPRRSAMLTLQQQGDEVVAQIQLRAPSVLLPAAAADPAAHDLAAASPPPLPSVAMDATQSGP
jgi:PAS domain S-box-containing protein